MNNTNTQKNIFLLPGEFYFGGKESRISTLLGSCVAITLWHPQKLIGGMCHYMLPSPEFRQNRTLINGKYAEDAMDMFLYEIKVAGTSPPDYQAKMFGGGNMFTHVAGSTSCHNRSIRCFDSSNCKNVACKNALIAPYLLKKHGFNIINQDLGGTLHRKVIFDVSTGDVWVRKGG